MNKSIFKPARARTWGGFLVFLLLFAFLILPSHTQAAIPKLLNFQGKLTKVSDGTNLANGNYSMEFKMYDALSNGNLLWTETYDQPSGNCAKPLITNGVFNVKLGACNSLANVDFTSADRYVSINFAPTGVAYDGEMSPRKRLVAASYAFNANNLVGDGRIALTPGAAPGLDIISVSNSSQASTTNAVDGMFISFAASNASGDALHITPAFAGGANDGLTYNVFEIDSFSPTNSAGTDTVIGIKIGNLTDPGATITSIGLSVGSGFDTGISIAAGGLNIAAGALAVNSDSITSDGTLVINASGSVDIQDALTADNLITDTGGVSIAAGQAYTGSGAVTLSSGGSSALTIDSATGTVSVATGDALLTSVAGDPGTPAAGMIWYDSSAGKYKVREGSTTKILCNTTDTGCGAGGGGVSTIEENNATVTSSAISLDFLGTDFNVTGATSEGDVAIDYTNSGITRSGQNETITGDWAFSFAAAESLDITSDLATAGTLNVASITGTPSATNGTVRGLSIINASSANANGLDVGLLIDNADDGVAIATGLNITSSGGGAITTGLDLSATDIGTGISLGANDITGTTTIVNFTNFDVDGSGNLDTGGTITAGSGNEAITLATGKIDADALTLTSAVDGGTGTSSGSGLIARSDGIGLLQGCSTGQVLAWVETTDTWDCTTPTSGSGTSKFVVKGSNENVASGTTLQNDNDLFFPVSAGETWVFNFVLRVTNINSATPDWKAAILGNTAWTCSFTQWMRIGATVAGQANGTDCDNAPTAVVNAAVVADANIPFTVNLQGTIAPLSSGNVTLQWAANTSGSLTVMAGSYVIAQRVGGSDLAEVYYTMDETMEPGDVIKSDSSIHAGVKKTSLAYDRQALGIISTKPGLLLGDENTDYEGRTINVALAGRVPVKVNDENGPIYPGDLLTSSSVPGEAMKAVKAGQVLGQALGSYDKEGSGTVLIFIQPGYFNYH